MASRALAERVVQTEPRRGDTITVEVDTHVTGSLHFASDALITMIASFDVWDSDLPHLEIYETLGTLSIADPDPLDGPNLSGGKILFRDATNARWLGMPRRQPFADWVDVEVRHSFTSTSHADNSRGHRARGHGIRDPRQAPGTGERRDGAPRDGGHGIAAALGARQPVRSDDDDVRAAGATADRLAAAERR